MYEQGGPEVLQYETVPTPKPAPAEVLVRVRAATVNHTDIFHRSGQAFIRKPMPHILGMDVAGEIAELGEGVTDWAVGDRVVSIFEALGRERDGAYAEYTTLPADQLYRIPDGLDAVAAAAIGLAFTTAWIALFYNGRLSDNERVVIHAASSGVGTSALQIANRHGAAVVAISVPDKADRLRKLGAHIVLDQRAHNLVAQVMAETNGLGASLVLDLVGGTMLQTSVAMLAPHGRVVCVGTLSGEIAEINVMDLITKNAQIIGSFGRISREDFTTVLQLFAEGTFQPVIDQVLPLSEARAAHERIESRAAFGKIILTT